MFIDFRTVFHRAPSERHVLVMRCYKHVAPPEQRKLPNTTR